MELQVTFKEHRSHLDQKPHPVLKRECHRNTKGTKKIRKYLCLAKRENRLFDCNGIEPSPVCFQKM